MQLKNLNTSFFLWIFLFAAVGMAVLLWPFALSIFVAVVLAMFFYPVYEKLLRFTRREVLSASLACALVTIVIILPFIFVGVLVTREAQGAYEHIFANRSFESTIVEVEEKARALDTFGLLQNVSLDSKEVASSAQNVSKIILSWAQAIYSGIVNFVFWLFVMLFTLFYFFLDGKKLVAHMVRLSPLRDRQDKLLLDRFRSITRATVKGTFIIGLVQGVMGGIVFAIAGVPSPITWGVIMVILAIIPLIGSSLVWIPAGVGLLLLGNVWQGIFVLALGFGVISQVDNVLRPKLVGGDTAIHPLLIFFASLGGIMVFGLIGFLLGPIIVAFFLALLEIYEEEFAKQLEKYNE